MDALHGPQQTAPPSLSLSHRAPRTPLEGKKGGHTQTHMHAVLTNSDWLRSP